VSAAPEPAENSAGAALVPALWEISARAALHAKPQARVRGIFISGERSPPRPNFLMLRTDGERTE
jgi:hypothetical protein